MVKTIHIQTDDASSDILIGEKLSNLNKYIPDNKVIIITDERVHQLYQKQLPDFPAILIGQGEKKKTLDTVQYIFKEFLDHEVDRSWVILAIGGGIVCDIAGFAASVYMRGLAFGFVSTTLLSQVDASVGGKNGVNFLGYKNMVGVFNQPSFVICDMNMLQTLDDTDYISGFAEIIKAAAIKDVNLFHKLEKDYESALNHDAETMSALIYESVQIKKNIVQLDEKEKGERRKLNFGHTFAHSIEKNLGISHGEAVSIGMVLASRVSEKLGMLGKDETNRLKNLLIKYKLPVAFNIPPEKLLAGIKKDKKREGQNIHMVLLDKPGNAIIKSISINLLEEIIYDLYSHI